MFLAAQLYTYILDSLNNSWWWSDQRVNARTSGQKPSNFLMQASWRLCETPCDLLVYNLQLPYKYDHWHIAGMSFGETFSK